MNEDMLAAGRGARRGALLRPRSTATTGSSRRPPRRWRSALGVPYVTTIHATEHGRHQGWVQDPPQSHIHAVERWMAHRADARDRLLALHARPRRRHLRHRRAARRGDPQRHRPERTAPGGRSAGAARASSPQPHEKLVLLVGRLVYEKGFQLALDALPGVIEQRRRRALPGRRQRHARGRAEGAGRAAGARRARHVPRLDRRRRAALALPHRRPVRGALDLRAVRAGRARGDGLGLPVHRRRHGRAARGRAASASASGCASTAATPSTSA